MKVNGNDPTHTTVLGKQRDFGRATAELFPDNHSNIPIRLEIASRIMAGNFGWYLDQGIKVGASITNADVAVAALRAADALIKAHNETCGGE